MKTRTLLSNSARTVLAALAALAAAAAQPAWAAGSSVQTFRHPAGFKVTLPEGWKTAAAEDRTKIVLAPGDAAGAEAYVLTTRPAPGVKSVTDPATLRATEQEMSKMYPAFQRVGRPVTLTTGLGPGVALSWEGETGSGIEVRATTYLTVTEETAVALIAVGEKERVLAREATLRKLFSGLAPERAEQPAKAQPGSPDDGSAAAKEWRARLSGKKLTMLSSYGSGSSGGYSSQYEIYLSPDGRFVYRGNSSVSIYVDGANGGSSGTQAAEGRWRIVTNGGIPMLEVTPNGGQTGRFRLSAAEGKTFLNGTRVFVTAP